MNRLRPIFRPGRPEIPPPTPARTTQGHAGCLTLAAWCLAVLVCALVGILHAQQPAAPYNVAPFNPATRRPAVSGDGADLMRLLVLATEGGPQGGNNWKMTATADGLTCLPARPARGKWAIQNRSTESVFWSFNPADKGATGWEVPAGASTSGTSIAAIYVWSASGTAEVRFVEGVWQ